MLTNAKLQITAVISMLIVLTVLGHFLAVASWDTKKTVLSANVSSNASVDSTMIPKALVFVRFLEIDQFCETYLLFLIHMSKIRIDLLWQKCMGCSSLFQTRLISVFLLNCLYYECHYSQIEHHLLTHNRKKTSSLQFPYLFVR